MSQQKSFCWDTYNELLFFVSKTYNMKVCT